MEGIIIVTFLNVIQYPLSNQNSKYYGTFKAFIFYRPEVYEKLTTHSLKTGSMRTFNDSIVFVDEDETSSPFHGHITLTSRTVLTAAQCRV